MWQIGVDVLPDYRGSGIGRAVVGTLTTAVLAEGALLYCSTAVGNLPSHRLAVSPGYWQPWIELYAR
jgi:predicted GNAT family acetyltransferase